MLGKVQDMVTAAIVVGAADKVSSDSTQTKAASTNTEYAASNNLSADSTDSIQPLKDSAATDNSDEEKKQDDRQMDEKSVSLMTSELNDLMSKMNCNIEFQYHKEVNMMSVKMIDKQTQEVLKEVPPEDMIQHMIKARDWLGAFLDKNA